MAPRSQSPSSRKDVLTYETVRLNARATDKVDATQQAGALLVRAGYVAPAYIDGMLERENVMSTYIGNGVAIPHGKFEDKKLIYHTGLSVVQLPEGVEWEAGEVAYLVIGIAARSDDHIGVLANLAEVLEEQSTVDELAHTGDPDVIVERLTRPEVIDTT